MLNYSLSHCYFLAAYISAYSNSEQKLYSIKLSNNFTKFRGIMALTASSIRLCFYPTKYCYWYQE